MEVVDKPVVYVRQMSLTNQKNSLVDKVPADCGGRIATPVLQQLNDNLTNFHLWQIYYSARQYHPTEIKARHLH